MKTLNLTFRMPTPVPLQTGCKYAFDLWFRINMNQLARLYLDYCKLFPCDDFAGFAESMFMTDRSICEPELN